MPRQGTWASRPPHPPPRVLLVNLARRLQVTSYYPRSKSFLRPLGHDPGGRWASYCQRSAKKGSRSAFLARPPTSPPPHLTRLASPRPARPRLCPPPPDARLVFPGTVVRARFLSFCLDLQSNSSPPRLRPRLAQHPRPGLACLHLHGPSILRPSGWPVQRASEAAAIVSVSRV